MRRGMVLRRATVVANSVALAKIRSSVQEAKIRRMDAKAGWGLLAGSERDPSGTVSGRPQVDLLRLQ